MQNKAKATRVTHDLFIYIIGALICFFGGMWLSTQQIARELNYPLEFGEPLLNFDQTPVYPPNFMYWWFKYGGYAPHEFQKASWYSLIGAALGIAFIIVFAFVRLNRRKELTSHGTARWATEEEVKNSPAELTKRDGVVLGLLPARKPTLLEKAGFRPKPKAQYLRHSGPEHIFVSAPPRTGKGAGLVVPTLLEYRESVLVVDIKKENYEATAGFRKNKLKQTVIKFEPTATDGSSARYNPFDEIRARVKEEVKDVQNVVELLVYPDGKPKNEGGASEHFINAASGLLTGAILHLLYTDPYASLPRLAMFLSRTDPVMIGEDEVWDFLYEMKATEHADSTLFDTIYGDLFGENTGNHPIVGKAVRDLLGMDFRERAGVRSTAVARLKLYMDPIVGANVSTSDFAVSDLMNHTTPVSLYIVIPPSDITRMISLVRLVVNQIINKLTVEMKYEGGQQVKMYKHKLLLMLDEFPALGRMEALETAFAYTPGYGIRAMIITQSMNQIYKWYGRDNSIVDNCRVRIVYTPNDPETADWISRILGTKTEMVENRSYQSSFINVTPKNVTVSTQESSRPLLTPGEVMQFPLEKEILLAAGTPPIMAKKVMFFKDRNFKKRLLDAPAESDRIRTPTPRPLTARISAMTPVRLGNVLEPEEDAEITDDIYAGMLEEEEDDS